MAERLMRDVTQEYERMRAQLLIIRLTLGLSPIHDVVQAVRTLHEEGRESFEKERGPKCEYAAQWVPR